MPNQTELRLFVSHVSEDRAAALEIVNELERRGVSCWIAPRDVHPGRPYDDEIFDAIEGSRAVLLIFSEHCNASDYIRREVTVAGESHKVIIPFRIEDVQPQRGLRVRLSDLHWIDAFASRERALDEVAKQFSSPADQGEEERRTAQDAVRRSASNQFLRDRSGTIIGFQLIAAVSRNRSLLITVAAVVVALLTGMAISGLT